jgi:hypothetical protein
MVPAAGMIENSSISRVNVEVSLKSLRLARSKVDVLLQQVWQNLFRLHDFDHSSPCSRCDILPELEL